ncbi:MAG: dehydrogenase, partial [Promethearchaeota archaeon]
NCLHPGVINTKLLDAAMGSVGVPASKGADTLIYAAMEPELENVSGKYFKNNSPAPSKKITYNKEIQQRLWQKTEEIIKMILKNH